VFAQLVVIVPQVEVAETPSDQSVLYATITIQEPHNQALVKDHIPIAPPHHHPLLAVPFVPLDTLYFQPAHPHPFPPAHTADPAACVPPHHQPA
tara:strand:+ start:393 stop:674 length:282 start_codon:yes stop_codon:yes gene_type:complete